jgi:hypothetical protein
MHGMYLRALGIPALPGRCMKIPAANEYPKEIKIGDEVYQIKFVNKVFGEARTAGMCDPEKRIIHIKRGQSLTETFNTFVHEVLHAFEFEYNIRISHRAVYKLERAISDLLMCNF